jgi:diphthine-ammonia ligase
LKVGVLYSGGKDSTYAAYLAQRQGHSLSCFITVKPESSESYLFHYPNAGWTSLQAEAVGVPLMTAEIRQIGEGESYDLDKVLEAAKMQYRVEGLVTGGLASKYQKDRFEQACIRVGLRSVSPLWQVDPETYMRSIIRDGFKVIVTGVAAEGLTEKWLGRVIDEEMISELVKLHSRVGVHIGFEGGEAETFVLDCPLFKRRVEVLDSVRHWLGDRGFLEILDAQLVEKESVQKS